MAWPMMVSIYSGALTDTALAGNYRARVLVEGTPTSYFTREAFVLGTVVSPTASFNGVFSDSGVDLDFDDLIDILQVSVGIDASEPGTYIVLGTLTDAAGNLQTVSSLVTFITVANTVTFNFNGEEIYFNGVDGPFT